MDLHSRIDNLLEGVSSKELKYSAEALMSAYRDRKRNGFTSDLDRLAYLAMRLPATHAVIETVFQKLDVCDISSITDVGAGPGTALFAAVSLGWSVESAHLIEQDRKMLAYAKSLLPERSFTSLCDSFLSMDSYPEAELVVSAFALNEVGHKARMHTLDKLWRATRRFLVIVEPGTPENYREMMEIRDHLLPHLVLPCPHHNRCPMIDDDWCHFRTRVIRSKLHRTLKSGVRGFEDEKFTYLVFSKQPLPSPNAVVVRKPLLQKGVVHTTLCTREGLVSKSFAKSDREGFRKAKNLELGDTF